VSKTVAVTSSLIAREDGVLKRALLTFDQIAVVPYDGKALPVELRWLQDRGVVVNGMDPFVVEGETAFTLGEVQVTPALLEEIFPGKKGGNMLELMIRTLAARLSRKTGWDTVSFGWESGSQCGLVADGQSRVLEIVLRAMPEPDDLTPWEAILEWRQDPQTQVHRRALNRWLSNVARAQGTQKDWQDEIGYLLDEYRQHLALHRMKASSGLVKTLIVTAADVAGKLASLKWGDAAKALFAVQERRIALLEAERSAPGRELAYIVKAHERFGGR
jgi:hypothetical protein